MFTGLHAKYPSFLSYFNKTSIFSTDSKNIKIKNFKKIRLLEAEFFCAEGGTDGQTDRQK